MMENIDLVHYVDQARKSGMTDEQIRQGLLQSGWSNADVDEALRSAPMTEVPLSKPKKMMSKSLAVILAVVVLAVAAYFASAYYFANYQNIHFWPYEKELVIPTFTPRPARSTSPGQSLDFARDWQIYRNEEYGFEIKYPGEYNFCLNDFCVPIPPEEDYCTPEFCVSSNTSIQYVKIWGRGQDDVAHRLEIRPLKNNLGITAIEFGKLTQELNEKERSYYIADTGSNIIFANNMAYQFEVENGFTEGNIMIKNGIEAFRVNNPESGEGWVIGSIHKIIYFDNKDVLYRITYPINDTIYNQILSTFEFIEAPEEFLQRAAVAFKSAKTLEDVDVFIDPRLRPSLQRFLDDLGELSELADIMFKAQLIRKDEDSATFSTLVEIEPGKVAKGSIQLYLYPQSGWRIDSL